MNMHGLVDYLQLQRFNIQIGRVEEKKSSHGSFSSLFVLFLDFMIGVSKINKKNVRVFLYFYLSCSHSFALGEHVLTKGDIFWLYTLVEFHFLFYRDFEIYECFSTHSFKNFNKSWFIEFNLVSFFKK